MFTRATRGQFSLRMLIFLTVVMACGLAYLSRCRSRASREQAIVKRYGAIARYDFQYDEDKDSYDLDAVPPGPWFLRRFFGDFAFARIHNIYIENDAVTCVDDLAELTGLKTAVIHGCKRLECIDGLANTKLRVLCIRRCPLLKNVDSLREVSTLKFFELKHCVSVQNVAGLRGANLKRFTLTGCPLVSDIDSLAGQEDLKFCHLIECSGLENVDGLRRQSLITFSISDCDQLLNPRGLSGLGHVGSMHLMHLGVASLKGVWPSVKVEKLRFFRCPNLQTIEGVDEAPELESLTLSECPSLTSLKGLENSKADIVYIFHCDELSDISVLDSMVNLRHVRIEDCPNVDPGEITALQNKLQKRR